MNILPPRTIFISQTASCMSKTTMNQLVNAFQLNNEGVSLLINAKENEAYTCFRDSLNLFFKVLQENEAKNNQQHIRPSSLRIESNSDKGSNQSENDCQSKQSFIYGKAVLVPYLKDDCYCIYNNAIRFDSVFNLSSRQPKQIDIKIFIATVILNIALAFHRQLILGRKQFENKAVVMYNWASKILMSEVFGSHHQELAFVILLGVTNNVSLIHHEEGEHHISLRGFQRLAYLLSKQHEYESCVLNDTISNDILEGMVLNIVATSLRPTVAGTA